MKKPDWFKLTENDQTEPYVGGVVPQYVLIALALGIAALFFLFPSKTGEQIPTPTPTAEVLIPVPDAVDSPIIKPAIKNPSIGTMPSGGDDDEDEEEEDEDDEDSED